MTLPLKLAKAELQELDDRGNPTSDRSHWVKVQFNPETLKVSYSNQVVPPTAQPTGRGRPGDQNPSSIQYVGKGSTKLSVQLWYDVTALAQKRTEPIEQGGGQSGDQNAEDVQQLTQKVIYYITPTPLPNDRTQFKPPSVSFVWGTFKFNGIMESLEESLEFFDSDGRPLRASIAITLARQEIVSTVNPQAAGRAGNSATETPGTRAMTPARSGDTVQGLASSAGQRNNWQSIAAANGIENPRQLDPGQLIDLSARDSGSNPFSS